MPESASSPEIVPISPPPRKRGREDSREGGKRRRSGGSSSVGSTSTSSASKPPPLAPVFAKAARASSKSKHKSRPPPDAPRARVTERMLNTLASPSNPITHSDVFARTAHVHSCSTGHQQRGSDRGFWAGARDAGISPAAAGEAGETHTYWSVRTAKVEAQSREKTTEVFKGCVVAINGGTYPLSNLQVQNLITSNGGRFSPHQHSGCTHVVTQRLAGGKTQKYINGQGARGAAQRTRAVRVEWVIDSAAAGRRLSEAGYGVIADPKNLFDALGTLPKALRATSCVPKDEASSSVPKLEPSGDAPPP